MFTITVSAMPAQSVVALRSMLLLLDSALGARWQVVDRPPADVVLLPAETLERLSGVAGTPGELPLYLALGNDETRPSNAYASLKRPITPPRLVEALNLAEGLIDRLRAPQDEMQTVPLIESFHSVAAQQLAPATFDARIRTTLRAATWRLLQDPIAATLINDERHSIFSHLPGAGYHTRLTPAEFAQVFRDNSPAVLLELSPGEREALKLARDFKPLRELEWVFWLCNKTAWLRPELSADKRYRLRRWPDFGRLPHYQGDLRLASFLMSQPLALPELRERACVPMETAMNFLNATYAVGVLAEATETAPAAAAPVAAAGPMPGGLRGLIANLRRKLGIAAPAAAPPVRAPAVQRAQ
jgi:hypothetical protein